LKNKTITFSEKAKDLVPYFIMAAFVLIVQVGSLWLSATEYIASQPPLENPESISYSIYYIIILLIFSAFLIFLIKKNKDFVIRAIIYVSIYTTLCYVFIAITDKAIGYSYYTLAFSLICALLLTVLIHKHPEWYVIDISGLLIAIGACALVGVSLSYMPIIVMMIGLLIYDFISVYKTKHMLTLAHGMMDLKLPILFVIPKKWGYSYIKDSFSEDSTKAEAEDTSEMKNADEAQNTAEADNVAEAKKNPEEEEQKTKSDALFMGLGDAVIPTLLVVSSNHFLEHDGPLSMPSLFAMIGTFVGFAALMYMVSKGKPQAGLPLLNTGTILGFIIGIIISGTAISINLI
jgi:Uncharacterized protein conserved in archaea